MLEPDENVCRMTEQEKHIQRIKGEATRRRRWEQRQEKKRRQLQEEEERRLSRRNEDERFMKEALRQAMKAALSGDIPIGCVIVCQGEVIACGYNQRQRERSVLAHAEILAIHKACDKKGDWRLEDCTMYVTLEPCPMCAGAIVQARIPRVVIGCMNPKAGCAGSVLNLLHEQRFNHQSETEYGILEEACSEVLKEFFQSMRDRHDI